MMKVEINGNQPPGGETVEKTVNNVKVIGIKKITGIDDTGTIQIELIDGSEVGLR